VSLGTLPIPGLMLSGTLPSSTLGAPLSQTPPTSPGTGATAAAVPTSFTNPLKGLGTFADYFRPTRIATFLVGALLIAGGIFALKPARDLAGRVTRAARRAGEAAA
jgi:hypothetical protein